MVSKLYGSYDTILGGGHVIEILIDNCECKILTRLNIDQIATLSSIMSFKVEGSEFKADALNKGRYGKWDGYKRLFNAQTQKFPTGLLPNVLKLFNVLGVQYLLVDKRISKPRSFDIICTPNEIRGYQREVLVSSIMNRTGIIKSATGSGKTTMAAMTIAEIGKKCVFIVHTKDLLYQAKESFESLLNVEIGQIGDGIVDIEDRNIVVATVQSLATVLDIFDKYSFDEDADYDENLDGIATKKQDIIKWSATIGMVLFDEVQRVASRTAFGVRYMFKNADYAFGYSASPWRDDGADLMIEGAFGPTFIDISASRLIREGHLIRPEITIKKNMSSVYSGESYNQIYKSAIVENTFRNMMVVNDAMEYYNRGLCTLVLVTQIKHGEMLEQMLRTSGCPTQFISGKSGSKKRKQVIDDMRSGKAPLIIASTIADVGLDVPRVSAMVEAGAGKSSVTALQRLGRIMRKFHEKDNCYFTTYRDNVPIIYDHINNKKRIWSTEAEFIIKEEK